MRKQKHKPHKVNPEKLIRLILDIIRVVLEIIRMLQG